MNTNSAARVSVTFVRRLKPGEKSRIRPDDVFRKAEEGAWMIPYEKRRSRNFSAPLSGLKRVTVYMQEFWGVE